MAQRNAVLRGRQQLEKRAEVLRIEFLGGHELPEDGTELVAEFDDPLPGEAVDRLARIREHLALVQKREAFR